MPETAPAMTLVLDLLGRVDKKLDDALAKLGDHTTELARLPSLEAGLKDHEARLRFLETVAAGTAPQLGFSRWLGMAVAGFVMSLITGLAVFALTHLH